MSSKYVECTKCKTNIRLPSVSNRYLVFEIIDRDTLGGMNDCKGKFNTMGDAMTFAIKLRGNCDIIQIYDTITSVITVV